MNGFVIAEDAAGVELDADDQAAPPEQARGRFPRTGSDERARRRAKNKAARQARRKARR